MRRFLPWLLILGILAGQSSRLAGIDPCEETNASHQSEHPHDHGGHDEHPCSPDHDKNCPIDHHNSHGFCCHQMPMATSDREPAASFLQFSLSPVRDDHYRVPDAPCSKLDKPPLI